MALPVLFSIIVLGGLGAVFGIMLGVASKKFAVRKDERAERVREYLPGANCGGCGFPGCDGLAAAIAAGKAEITSCAPLSAENAAKIGEVMGVSVGDVVPKVARVMCLGSSGNCKNKFDYDGAKDCRAAYAIASGFKACRFACLGLGTCAKVCKFGAIKMGRDGIAFIDEEKCTGCGRCVEQCPQSSIAVLDRDIDVYAGCTNIDKGKAVTQNCSAGCIGCGICAKSCPFGAITMEHNLPVVDYGKCRSCWVCVEKCPRKCMLTTKPDKKAVIIEEKCKGCHLCAKACPFEAIDGEPKEVHRVNENCRGCGLCLEKCRLGAVEMVNKKTGGPVGGGRGMVS
jgi:electron transport complex protein RnfB